MNNEVCFVKDSIVKINASVIRKMKDIAVQNYSGKFRYCFHESEEAGMQEMLFVMPGSGYARPHMHKNVAESHVILEGEGYCVLYDLNGGIIEGFKVSKDDNFIYRIQKSIYHMIIPTTKQIVIYEVREGKFDSNTNIYAEWAPQEDETDKIIQYKLKVLHEIEGV